MLGGRKLIASINSVKFFPLPSFFSTYQRGNSKGFIGNETFIPTRHASPRNHDVPMSGSQNFPARFFSCKSSKDGEIMEMKLEILSKQNIKPRSPTPRQLKTYKVSILDQLNPHIHMPSLYFYQNDIISMYQDNATSEKRLQILRQSLSETLARFFPFAGKVRDNQHIECNDDGVYYVEARAHTHLNNILHQHSSKQLHHLLPFHPNSDREELFSQTYPVMIQVNVFDCGGIAIGLYTTHKIIDGYTRMTFMKAWSATARGFRDQISPNYIAPSMFLPNPTLPQHMSLVVWPSQIVQGNYSTKRFRFDASAIASLKSKAVLHNTSRVLAVTGLIWKCALSTFRQRSGYQRPSVLVMPVNLRNRATPNLPPYAIGDIYWPAVAEWPEYLQNVKDVEIHSIIDNLKAAIARIDGDFIEGIKGEKGSVHVIEHWKKLEKLYSTIEVPHSLTVSSLCNGGLYDVDFGWGRPIWTCTGYNDPEVQLLSNFMFLYDTRSGDGIEAWVTMNKEDMDIFETDAELLAFAKVNPSPLEA